MHTACVRCGGGTTHRGDTAATARSLSGAPSRAARAPRLDLRRVAAGARPPPSSVGAVRVRTVAVAPRTPRERRCVDAHRSRPLLAPRDDEVGSDGQLRRHRHRPAPDARLCEQHVDALSGDASLLDEFHVIASGGSSGRRGVFVYDQDAWATCYSSIVRFPARDRAQHPELASRPPVVVAVAAAKASHISAALGATFSSPDLPRHSVPVNQPMAQIVDRLNELQPTTLMGYGSFLPATRGGIPRPSPAHRSATRRRDLRAALARSSCRSRSDMGCARGERLRHVRGPLRRLLRLRIASSRRPVSARTGHRRRNTRRRRNNVREGLRDEPLQRRRPPHPLRGHRRTDDPGRTVSVRIGVPTDRRPARATRRHVRLSERHRRPPARVPVGPRPATPRRVPGPPNRRGADIAA